jgi:putative endonuclease
MSSFTPTPSLRAKRGNPMSSFTPTPSLRAKRGNLYNIFMNSKQYFIYILTNHTNTVLYTGITNNLIRRVWEHKNSQSSGFTTKYKVNKLVYFEVSKTPYEAISREKQIKNWHREWKINLIKQENPEFKDLYNSIL